MELTPKSFIPLARAAREGSTRQVLEVVAKTLSEVGGFQECVVNVYRPAWDDYRAVAIVGSQALTAELSGTQIRASELDKLASYGHELVPGIVLITAESGAWEDFEGPSYAAEIVELDHRDAWRRDDALMLKLTDAAHHKLGAVSLDMPVNGMRPTREQMQVMRVIANYAEDALEIALLNEQREASERVSLALVQTATELLSCGTRDEMHAATFNVLTSHLGFERAAMYTVRPREPGMLLRRTRGWDDSGAGWLTPELDAAALAALLRPELETDGCWLLPARDLFPGQRSGVRSNRNGRGPHGWNDGCLVVPLMMPDGELGGAWVVEDPVDHAIPGSAQRRALRVIIDQVAVATGLIDTRQELLRLAHYDPLTGLRNRRGLDDEIACHEGVAVLICDIDSFKVINDLHGHAVGDEVLERFGELLRRQLREQDVAIRIGGEEFCVVLPHTDRSGALEAAERLRLTVEREFHDLVPGGVTTSVGLAVADGRVENVRDLLAEADRGVYAAKRSGRNRVGLPEHEGTSISDDRARGPADEGIAHEGPAGPAGADQRV